MKYGIAPIFFTIDMTTLKMSFKDHARIMRIGKNKLLNMKSDKHRR